MVVLKRVIWDLSHELQKPNKVYIIGPEVDSFEYASAINCKLDDDLVRNLPDDIDIVHFHSPPSKNFPLPHVFTMHGNAEFGSKLPIQTIFISKTKQNVMVVIILYIMDYHGVIIICLKKD